MSSRKKPIAWPLISVVVPTYNCETFISEALNSVVSQNYPNLEIIVVDDGSLDGTVEKIRTFGDGIRLVQQANQGPGAARNHGARVARGEYLAFLDGDDVWLPGKLRAQIQHIKDNPSIQLVYGHWRRWYPDSDGSYTSAEEHTTIFDAGNIDVEGSGWVYCRLLLDSILHTITVLMRRRLFEDVGGFDASLRRGEDYDLWIRLSRLVPMHKLEMTLALYRMHPKNTTWQPTAENYEYRVLANALRQYGYSGPDGVMASHAHVEQRMLKLCFQQGYMHFWRGSPCTAVKAFCGARKHGDSSVKTLAYASLSSLRCMFRLGASKSV